MRYYKILKKMHRFHFAAIGLKLKWKILLKIFAKRAKWNGCKVIHNLKNQSETASISCI
jgi:hypothetical protein